MTDETSDETSAAQALEAIRLQIHEFIQMNFLYDGVGADSLDDDASLLQQGVLDQTGVLELLLFIEEGYGLTIAQEDLGPEHFDSVNRIAAYVVSRVGVA